MANLYFCVNCNNNSVDYKYSNVLQKGVLWLLLEELEKLNYLVKATVVFEISTNKKSKEFCDNISTFTNSTPLA